MARNPQAAPADFETALKLFARSTQQSMVYARICAEMGIKHFQAHGDLSYCQRFFDAMENTHLRRVAYVTWLASHAPVVLEASKFRKDVSEKAVKWDLEAAISKPFWEFAPEPGLVNFDITDIDKALIGLIRRFSANERYVAKDSNVLAYIGKVKQAIATVMPAEDAAKMAEITVPATQAA